MKFLDTGYGDAETNMAVDEKLLEGKGTVLRFYRWKPACLSIGHFQSTKELDTDKFVRRVTGGKAVWHDKELTYSFVTDEKNMPSKVIDSYKVISQPIVAALKDLGLDAEMQAKMKKKASSANCFDDPSYYEITVNGRKIVGSAQKRKDGRLLQHGSILLEIDHDELASKFKDGNADEIRKRVTSVNQELGRKVSYRELAKILKKKFQEAKF